MTLEKRRKPIGSDGYLAKVHILRKRMKTMRLIQSGKEFNITSSRVAASNPLLKDAFMAALQQKE